MKYICTQRYYDNGRVNAQIVQIEDHQVVLRPIETNFDFYADEFDTWVEANKCKQAALTA